MRISALLVLASVFGAGVLAHAVEPQPLFPVSLPKVPANGLVGLREPEGKTHFLPRMHFKVETDSAQLKVSYTIDEQGCADQLYRMKNQPKRACYETTSSIDTLTGLPLSQKEFEFRVLACESEMKKFMSQADLTCLGAEGLSFSIPQYLKEPVKGAVPARGEWSSVTFPIDRSLVSDLFNLGFDYRFTSGQSHPVFTGTATVRATR